MNALNEFTVNIVDKEGNEIILKFKRNLKPA